MNEPEQHIYTGLVPDLTAMTYAEAWECARRHGLRVWIVKAPPVTRSNRVAALVWRVRRRLGGWIAGEDFY